MTTAIPLALALFAAATAQSGLIVVEQPKPAPEHHRPDINPPYPRAYLPLRPRVKVRCEQDRSLVDTTPCGGQEEQSLLVAPRKAKRCEMDRALTDETPCDRRLLP